MISWSPIAYGAGGWVTDIETTGGTGAGHYQYCRCDTTGAYKRALSGDVWERIVRTDNVPFTQLDAASYGVWEIKHAPSDPTRAYMVFSETVLVSNDSMDTWQATSFTPVASADPNATFRMCGNRLAVDPINKDVVYFGSEGSEGLRYTTDGFATADVQETDVPVPTLGGYAATGIQIIFDPYTGAAISGRTARIWAFSYGSACKRSDDAGATWSTITGGPTGIRRGVVATNGDLYVTAHHTSGQYKVWRWNQSGTAWVDLSAGTNYVADEYHAPLIDPSDPATIHVWALGGRLIKSTNSGSAWNHPDDWDTTTVADDIPWLQPALHYQYLSCGNAVRDPGDLTQVLVSNGVGVIVGDLTSIDPIDYHTESEGIEQLCVDQLLVLPNGTLLTALQDRGVMFHTDLDVFPSGYVGDYQSGVIHCFSMDYYPKDNPTILTGVLSKIGGVELSGYGPIDGSSWTEFTNPFAGTGNEAAYGNIAIGSSTNFVWAPGWDRYPLYSTDAGVSWDLCTFSPAASDAGGFFGGAFSEFNRRHTLVADPNDDGTFYIWHGTDGMYRSTDGGENWTLRIPESAHAGLSPNLGAPLLSFIPGSTGKLLYTAGRSIDYDQEFFIFDAVAETATPISGITGVYQFGFGASATGETVPSVIMVGKLTSSGLRGIYITDDWFATYRKIGEELDVRQQFETILTLTGDPTRYGRVYVGFSGSGGAYGQLSTGTRTIRLRGI
jgi:hypothetical protein